MVFEGVLVRNLLSVLSQVKVVYAQKKMRGNVPVMSHKPSFAFVGVSREKLFAAAPHAEEVVRTWQGNPGRSPNTFDVVTESARACTFYSS